MNILQSIFSGGKKADLKVLLEQGAYLVDVRTPGEFAAGNIPGSVNIPLDKLASQLSKFENKKNIIVFCRSGNRSGQAKSILEQNGFTNVADGGAMEYVSQFVK